MGTRIDQYPEVTATDDADALIVIQDDGVGGKKLRRQSRAAFRDSLLTEGLVDAVGDELAAQGLSGADGWSAVTAVEADGARRVLKVVAWFGGEGTPPPVGVYIGPSGFVATAAEATDVRGAQGPAGEPGDGSGDMLRSTYDPDNDGVIGIAQGGTGASDAAAAFAALKQAATTSATGVVELATDADTVTGTDTARAVTPAAASAKVVKDWFSVLIEKPANQDYVIGRNLPVAITVVSITTRCASGTCTLTGKIGATPLGGTANAASSSEQVQAHASANVAAAGDDLAITVSSNASCLRLEVTVAYTRALGTG